MILGLAEELPKFVLMVAVIWGGKAILDSTDYGKKRNADIEESLRLSHRAARAADEMAFRQNGFRIVGNHSTELSSYFNCYTLTKLEDNGLTYTACASYDKDKMTSSISKLRALERS